MEQLKKQLTSATGQSSHHGNDTDRTPRAVVDDLTSENTRLKTELTALQEKFQDSLDVVRGALVSCKVLNVYFVVFSWFNSWKKNQIRFDFVSVLGSI